MGTATERERASPEARACKEILLSISVLLPKVQAAKHVLPVGAQEAEAGEGSSDETGAGGGAGCEFGSETSPCTARNRCAREPGC
jgi:hypothetical protein